MRRTRGDDDDELEASAAARGDDGGGQGCKGFGGGGGSADESMIFYPINKCYYPTWSWDFQGYETQISYPTSKYGLRLWTTAISRKQKNKNYSYFAGNFDHHADPMVRWGAHRPMEHILSFTRSHWMPPSGECLGRIARPPPWLTISWWKTQSTLTKTTPRKIDSLRHKKGPPSTSHFKKLDFLRHWKDPFFKKMDIV